MSNQLLPCEDTQWDNGVISYNGHVLSPNLEGVQLGHFAQVCQAAHILGRVQQHRIDYDLEQSSRLDEAFQLCRTLSALDAITQESTTASECGDDAIAICCSARFLLYELYACNERYDGSPAGQEAKIQQVSLQGIEECVARMYHIALRLSERLTVDYHTGSILVTHALYWAASECRWYVNEGKEEAVEVLETLTNALKLLKNRWRRAGMWPALASDLLC